MGSVTAVLTTSPGAMPGSGCTGPNPHSVPRPTQPDQMDTAAGAAITASGQRFGIMTAHLPSQSMPGLAAASPGALFGSQAYLPGLLLPPLTRDDSGGQL